MNTQDIVPAAQRSSKWIEDSRRLSESKLWDLQQQYFKTMGVEAWKEDVPFYVSSNAFIGHQYALLVKEALLDIQDELKSGDTVTILELGCGTGKFSFHFIKSLIALLQGTPLEKRFRYVMSDMTEKNILFCEENPSLKPFVEQGVLDFALFHAERDTDFRLRGLGKQYSDMNGSPLIIIANYIFDCLRHDYLIWQQEHYQGLNIALSSRYKNYNQAESKYLNEVLLAKSFEAIDIDQYYDDVVIRKILNDYKSQFIGKNAILPVPLACFQFMDNMKALTNDNAIIIMGDKGIANLSYFTKLDHHYDMTFEGCYTFLLNFHMVGEYLKAHQGDALLTEKNNQFQVCLYALGRSFEKLPQLKTAFQESIEGFGPQDFVSLFNATFQNAYRYSSQAMVAFLRLSHWDPYAFAIIFDRLFDVFKAFPIHERLNFMPDLKKVENNIYHLAIGHDANNLLGMLYQQLGEEEKAIKFFQRSIDIFKKSEAAYHNLGLMYEARKDKQKALSYYEKAIEKNKHNKLAKRRAAILKNDIKVTVLGPLLRLLVVLGGIAGVMALLVYAK